MTSPQRIKEAQQRYKLPIYCASCTKFWRARDLGIPAPGCLGTSCGSPMGGHLFEQYEGPISDTERWCLICGNPSDKLVGLAGRPKFFGVCALHLPFVVRLAPKDPLLESRVPMVVKDRTGIEVAEKLVEHPKSSGLVREMQATQEEWDYEDRKRGPR